MPTTYAIPNGSTAFAATLYTGNSSTQSVSNAVNGTSFQPDFVWIKNRSGANNHILTDAVRGATKTLFSDSTSAELTVAGALTAFNSNGFQVGYDGSAIVNTSANNYVGWQWKAGGSAVTNTAGSITSQVSANTAAGFSIVTYTEPSGLFTVGHGLGVSPNMVIIKSRSTAENWVVWVPSFAANQAIYLNGTAAVGAAGANWISVNSSTLNLTSGQFTSPGTKVAYCFAAVPGYSAFGSYTGNGSTDGPFCYTGFRPRFVMVKRTDSGDDWVTIDTSRNTYNAANSALFPNSYSVETTNSNYTTDVLSNGFKLRATFASVNANGGNYIYACFAECPLKYSNAR
jgi:hypothetical protein